MAFLDDMKNKIKNVDTDKLKEQIGNATGAAKNAVQQNLESLKNGQAGEKFNNLKGEYQKMPKNKKIIFGVCAIVALFIVIGGIKSLAGSDDPAEKLTGKWDCTFDMKFDFNVKENIGALSYGGRKTDRGPLKIISQKDNNVKIEIVYDKDSSPLGFDITFDDNNKFNAFQKGKAQIPITCNRVN